MTVRRAALALLTSSDSNMRRSAPFHVLSSRALAVLSLVLGCCSVVAVLVHGPALLFGAMSLGSATTAGTIHKQSRLAPAMFLVDLVLVVVAAILFFGTDT